MLLVPGLPLPPVDAEWPPLLVPGEPEELPRSVLPVLDEPPLELPPAELMDGPPSAMGGVVQAATASAAAAAKRLTMTESIPTGRARLKRTWRSM